MASKILMLHNYYLQSGGEDSVVINEVNTLRFNGFDVTLLKFNNTNYSTINPLKYIFALNSIFSLSSFIRVYLFIKIKKITILHVHNFNYTATPSVFWAAKLAGVKTIHTIHNYRLFCLNAMFYRNNKICFECNLKQSLKPGIKYKCFKGSFFASLILAFTIKLHKILPTFDLFVDKYIVLNLFTKDLLLKFGIKNNKIFYKSNYLPNTAMVDVIKKEYYLYAGRLSYEKGMNHLIATFNSNKKPLIIAGDGDLRENLLNIKLDNIEFVGFKDKKSMITLMQEAKALIFPSIWIESMPMTIIESLSLGTIPIIAHSINTDKMIDDRINGILYDANDSNGLNNAINFFESLSTEQKNIMSQMAILKFNTLYSEKVHLEKIKDIYLN